MHLVSSQFKVLASIVVVLFSITNTYAVEQPPLTHGLTKLTIPEIAPSLRLQDMDEEYLDINSLKGKVVVVNFWATWCPPCRREMSSLDRLYLATKDNNVEVLAVNVGEDIDSVFSFINSIEPSPNFTILFDTDSSVMDKWKVFGLPTTYVVNPEGYIIYRAVGGREFDHPDILEKVISLTNKDKT